MSDLWYFLIIHIVLDRHFENEQLPDNMFVCAGAGGHGSSETAFEWSKSE